MIDITPFCIRFDRVAPDRLRMCINVAPGFGGQLATSLRRFGARRKNSSCAVVAVPKSMATLAAEFGLPQGLVAAVKAYADAWSGANRGSRVDTHRFEARRNATLAVLSYEQGLYSSFTLPDPNLIINVAADPPSPPPPPPQQTPCQTAPHCN